MKNKTEPSRLLVVLAATVFVCAPVGADSMRTEKLCHVPTGHADNAHTITVSPWAVASHLEHGDSRGECPVDSEGPPAPAAKSGQSDCWE